MFWEIVFAIVVAFLIIFFLDALLVLLLVLLGGIVVLALVSGIGYLLLPMVQNLRGMGAPDASFYVVLSFIVTAICGLIVAHYKGVDINKGVDIKKLFK